MLLLHPPSQTPPLPPLVLLSWLTYELNGLQEPGADVLFVVVLHWDALVLVGPLEVVGAVGGDVEQGCDAQAVQRLLPGGMEGTAQVEEGQDLHWTSLGTGEERRCYYICVHSTTRI